MSYDVIDTSDGSTISSWGTEKAAIKDLIDNVVPIHWEAGVWNGEVRVASLYCRTIRRPETVLKIRAKDPRFVVNQTGRPVAYRLYLCCILHNIRPLEHIKDAFGITQMQEIGGRLIPVPWNPAKPRFLHLELTSAS